METRQKQKQKNTQMQVSLLAVAMVQVHTLTHSIGFQKGIIGREIGNQRRGKGDVIYLPTDNTRL